jgi:SanA protein
MRLFAWIRMTSHAQIRVAGAMALFLLLDLLWIEARFPRAFRERTFSQETLPPPGTPALVLGAGVYADREPTQVLYRRLQVALDLHRVGKVSWFLVSGDNRTAYYNEPAAMRRWLIRQGVEPTLIVSDYAGRRTWDSLRRAQAVFGLRRVVIVTSDFHLPRALYIAQVLGLEATGVPSVSSDLRWTTRLGFWALEFLARHVAIWDSWFPPDTRLGPREPTPEDWLGPRPA